MSPRDVHHDDMFDDDPVLAAFARDLERAGASAPPPVVGAALASILDGSAPVVTYPEVTVPAERSAPRRRRARLRWAVGSAVFGLGVGSLGIAGALPGPVQRQVSDLADHVGVHLPDGRDEPAPGPTTTTTLPAPATTGTHRPTTTVPSTVVVVDPEDDAPGTSIVHEDNGGHGNGNGNGHGADDGTDDDELGNGHADDEAEDNSGHGNADDDADEDADADEGSPVEEVDDRSGHGGRDDSRVDDESSDVEDDPTDVDEGADVDAAGDDHRGRGGSGDDDDEEVAPTP